MASFSQSVADRHGVATQIEKVRLFEMARESGTPNAERIEDCVSHAVQFLERRKKVARLTYKGILNEFQLFQSVGIESCFIKEIMI